MEKTKRQKMAEAILKQKEETRNYLRRQLAKGEITQNEFDEKTK